MEWHFAIKWGRPIKMALVIINFVTEFPNKAKEPVCQKWNGEFRSEYSDRNMRTTSGGDPQYSGQKKPKWTFSIEFRPKFLESLVKWKAPYLGYSRVLAVEHSVTWRLGQYLMYKTTNEIRNHRVGERVIAQPLELQMMWIICEFCYWKVTKWRSSDPLRNNYIPRETWIFFGINARVYTKKIQVSRGIFHGATDGAWLAEMVRLRKMFEKLGSIFLQVVRRVFAELVGLPKIFCLSNRALFPCLHIASSKHEEGWENCPNPPSVKIRLCKHV